MSQEISPSDLEQAYHDCFEKSKSGQIVLAHLVSKFGRARVHTDGGIDAVLKTYTANAQRSVVDHILVQINRANGVQEPDDAA